MSKTVVLLGVGGTIAGHAADAGDNVGYAAGAIGIRQLLDSAGELSSELGGVQFRTEQVAQLDSKDMSFEVWLALAMRVESLLRDDAVDALVITHGTDTLEETAFFLDRVLVCAKPVVFTCAMRPATSRQADGPHNLRDAIALACDAGARGALVVCAGKVHAATQVHKVHPYRLDPFTSVDAGPLAYVEELSVRWVSRIPRGADYTATARFDLAMLPQDPGVWARVELIMSHAGATGWTVDALIAQNALCRPGVPRVAGIVVAGTGNGTLHESLVSALQRAEAAGIQVVRASRCLAGRVLPTVNDQFAHSQGLSPAKARIELMLQLIQRLSQPVLQTPVP